MALDRVGLHPEDAIGLRCVAGEGDQGAVVRRRFPVGATLDGELGGDGCVLANGRRVVGASRVVHETRGRCVLAGLEGPQHSRVQRLGQGRGNRTLHGHASEFVAEGKRRGVGEQQPARHACIQRPGIGRKKGFHEAPLDASGDDRCEAHDRLARFRQRRESREDQVFDAARNATPALPQQLRQEERIAARELVQAAGAA